MEEQKIHTVSSAQWRFVATIPVGPLFNHPTTYSPGSTSAVSDSLLRILPLKFGTTPAINKGSLHKYNRKIINGSEKEDKA
jgi:hypothetical protein